MDRKQPNRKQRRATGKEARAPRAISRAPKSPAPVERSFAEAVRQHETGNGRAAERLYLEVLGAAPRHAAALHLLGMLNCQMGRPGLGADLIGRAIEIDATSAAYRSDLGIALAQQGRLDAAMESYRKALELAPDDSKSHSNMGLAFQELGALDEAVACFRRAIELTPDDADGHWNLALALLLDGDYARGWEEYEWRWRVGARSFPRLRAYPQPLWDGEDRPGGTMLLWAEQGFGDSIQFARYVPALIRRGWNILIEAPAPLARLFRTIEGATLIAPGQPAPQFDVHSPLGSLPRLFGTRVATIPAPIPYFRANPDLAAEWHRRLAGLSGRKIGICWRGQPSHRRDRNRSMDPARFAPLLAASGLSIVSLQQDARADELASLGRPDILGAGPALKDFADTAGLMANLDLVISVDTSVCHLAGALGIPTWTLLDFAPDWRWLRARDDSPWYPTMRLFRQAARGDWAGVIANVRAALG